MGDCARAVGPEGTPEPSVEHWENAQRDGAAAAAALVGEEVPARGAPPSMAD